MYTCPKTKYKKPGIDACRIFQPYFYKNLFRPQCNTAILSHETLNKSTVQTLLNELFSLTKDTKKRILKEYMVNKNIKLG